MKEPRVLEIVKNYQKGNIKQVYDYLTQDDMVVDPSTWSGKVKSMIENKQYASVKELIEIVGYKFLNK